MVCWDEWRGLSEQQPTMLIKRLFCAFGFGADLHKFVGPDGPECFHTHRGYAIRIPLSGGYIEEIEGGRLRAWRAGDIGLVTPQLSHRVHALLYGRPAFTLWVYAPGRHKVHLRGDGWPPPAPPPAPISWDRPQCCCHLHPCVWCPVHAYD